MNGTASSISPSSSPSSTTGLPDLGAQAQDAEAAQEAPMTDIATQIPDVKEWLPETLQPYWELLESYPIIGSAVVVVLAFVVAKVVQTVILRAMGRLASRSQTDLDDQVMRLLAKPLFNTVFLFGMTIAVRLLQLSDSLSSNLIKLLISLIILSWLTAGLPAFKLVCQAIGRNHHRFPLIEERTVPLFDLIGKIIILIFAAYVLLSVWGINPVGLLASAGVVGIAVGFAAKDTLANLFSGFFILADTPYKLGDYVNLDSGDRGKVTHVGMRSTRLLTRDDVEITIPNAVIANAKIINESGGPWPKNRIRIPVGVAYGSDVDEVCAVLQAVGNAHGEICDEPAPRVRMRGFGASSLDFELMGWIEQAENRGRIRHEMFMAVYKALNEADIEIPFDKRDLYIKEMPGSIS